MTEKDTPYTEMIRQKLISAVSKLVPLESANNEFKSGYLYSLQESIKVLKETEL